MQREQGEHLFADPEPSPLATAAAVDGSAPAAAAGGAAGVAPAAAGAKCEHVLQQQSESAVIEVVPRRVKRPRTLAPRRAATTRQWARRSKPSMWLIANFPWEVVFKHLQRHSRSLILMHMVNKHLAGLLRNDHALWLQVFKRDVYRGAHATSEVRQTRYPGLRLFKAGVTGIPMHHGSVRGDHDDHKLAPGFDQVFTAYVRRAFALQNGHRCGLCGCRWHHDPYWSLGMRVCKLCMAGNLVSSWELLDRYGVHYSDVARKLGHGRVFYFFQQFTVSSDHTPPYGALPADHFQKRHMWVFWRPHLAAVLDLPALYQEQKLRKAAAKFLSAVARRARVWVLRCEYGPGGGGERKSLDAMLIALNREERRSAVVQPWTGWRGDYPSIGGPDWAFLGGSRSGRSRHETRWKESRHSLASFMFAWEDSGPGSNAVEV